MGIEDLAQYGIAVFAVGGLFWLLGKGIDAYCAKGKTGGKDCDKTLVALENNTRAMEGLGEVLNLLRVAQAEQSTMLKELVSHARKN